MTLNIYAKTRVINCAVCGVKIITTSRNQKYCEKCKLPVKKRQIQKRQKKR